MPKEPSSSPSGGAARAREWLCFFGKNSSRQGRILEALKRYDAEGAIQFTQWGCRQSQGMVVLLREKLLEAGYPVLFLDGDHLDRRHSAPEQLRTRLEAFVEVLEGRGGF
uniref:2-hydroxyacyl-CoA dehydratase n=1 Tax=Candidatus Caldatribacterium saccharofermentans TaxID=1454753 RepID=A0A7V4TID2_9BACT